MTAGLRRISFPSGVWTKEKKTSWPRTVAAPDSKTSGKQTEPHYKQLGCLFVMWLKSHFPSRSHQYNVRCVVFQAELRAGGTKFSGGQGTSHGLKSFLTDEKKNRMKIFLYKVKRHRFSARYCGSDARGFKYWVSKNSTETVTIGSAVTA